MATGAGSLLERGAELARIDAALSAARDGSGRVLVLEGAAGMGKTSLLGEAAGHAAAAGLEVRGARGDDLERGFAWGVAIQLFGDVARDPGAGALLGGAAGLARQLFEHATVTPTLLPDPFPLLHGLYWLTVNLSERAPLALLVDDAHWSDPESLQFLVYLLGRIEGLGLSVIVAARPGDPISPRAEDLLDRLRAHPDAETVTLRPLSDAAIHAMIERELPHAEDAFRDAIAGAVAGNPFHCRAMLDAIRAEAVEPTAHAAAGLRRLRPGSVRRSIAVRLGRLGDDARRLAAAVAVLGGSTTLPVARELAGLDEAAAARALDALAAADILTPGATLTFSHPIVGEVIHGELEPGRLERDHLAAARLLRDRGAGAAEIARHLLLAGPSGEPWSVEVLREAALTARARGAPEAAAELLRRAIEEAAGLGRPDPGLLLELGRIEVALGEPVAFEHLDAAARAARAPAQRAGILAATGLGRYMSGDPEAGARLMREALDAVPPGAGGPDEGELLAVLGAAARSVPGLVDSFRELLGTPRAGPDGEPSPAELARQAWLAYDHVLRGDRGAAQAAADRFMAGDRAAWSAWAAIVANLAICMLGRHEDSRLLCTHLVEQARSRGDRLLLAGALESRVYRSWTRGDLTAALADSESISELSEGRWDQAVIPSRVVRALALLERGEDRAAAEAIDVPAELEPHLRHSWAALWLPYGRAAVAYAAGDWARAAEQAVLAGERMLSVQIPSPDYHAWRSLAARALHRLGDPEAGLALAGEELERARAAGSPRATGIALTAVGTLLGATGGTEPLSDAVEVLDRTGAPLEAARARLALGRALRRARRVKEARVVLGEAADAAQSLGALRVAEAALGELRAAGGRPQRVALSGVESLTPGHRRVADLAVHGLSNREIAETLFLTVRTVETHLTATYAKLRIGSREELAAILRESPAAG